MPIKVVLPDERLGAVGALQSLPAAMLLVNVSSQVGLRAEFLLAFCTLPAPLWASSLRGATPAAAHFRPAVGDMKNKHKK